MGRSRHAHPRRAHAALGILGVAFALVLWACGRPASSGDGHAGPTRIVVTIPPLEGLVRAIVPEGARITTLIAPGTSEHGYEPTPRDLADLASADVIVYVGLDLDPKIARFVREHPSLTRMDVCFAQVVGLGGEGTYDEEHDHEEHAHDAPHEHALDPHLWLDPALVRRLVPALGEAMSQARGDGKDAPRKAAALAERVTALDAELASTLAPIKGRAIVTHHNAWSRFAERYGLTVAAVIRANEGAEPTPEAIAASVEAVRSRGARGIFVEPQFSPAAAEAIARASGARLGVLDPLGKGDWFELMRANARALVETLKD